MVRLWPKLGRKRARQSRHHEEFRTMMQPMLYARTVVEHEKKARAEGFAEGFVSSFLAVYEARFGAVPRGIATAATAVDDPAVRRDWLRLVATASAEEVAAALLAAPSPAKKRAPAARRRAKA
jgi:hypothetical protein